MPYEIGFKQKAGTVTCSINLLNKPNFKHRLSNNRRLQCKWKSADTQSSWFRLQTPKSTLENER